VYEPGKPSRRDNGKTGIISAMQSWHAIESLRWIGLLSLAAILAASIGPVIKSVSSAGQSISQLWAAAEKHHLLISVVLTVGGAGLCAYILGWLIPTYKLWPGMNFVALAGYLAILAVAWFPMIEAPGLHSWRHPHFIGGAVVAYGAVVGYLVILLSGTGIPHPSRIIAVIALAYSAFWPVLFLPGIRNYFMILETILVVLFIAVIATLTLG